MPTMELLNEEQYEQCVAESHRRAVLLFKHSTRCPVSTDAQEEFEGLETAGPGEQPAVLLARVKVIEQRCLSDYIARETGIPHHSPQAILLVRGRPAWNESHHRITHRALQEALGKHAPAAGVVTTGWRP